MSPPVAPDHGSSEAWTRRTLDASEVVYVWAHGIYVKAGLEREKAGLFE